MKTNDLSLGSADHDVDASSEDALQTSSDLDIAPERDL